MVVILYYLLLGFHPSKLLFRSSCYFPISMTEVHFSAGICFLFLLRISSDRMKQSCRNESEVLYEFNFGRDSDFKMNTLNFDLGFNVFLRFECNKVQRLEAGRWFIQHFDFRKLHASCLRMF